MKKEDIIAKINTIIPGEEKIEGIFQAQATAHLKWHFIFGAFAAFFMKFYIVTVTDRKVYFHRLKLSGRDFNNTDYYEYHMFNKFIYRRGILQHKLIFKFKEGGKIKLKAQAKGLQNVLKIDDKTLEFLDSKIKNS